MSKGPINKPEIFMTAGKGFYAMGHGQRKAELH